MDYGIATIEDQENDEIGDRKQSKITVYLYKLISLEHIIFHGFLCGCYVVIFLVDRYHREQCDYHFYRHFGETLLIYYEFFFFLIIKLNNTLMIMAYFISFENGTQKCMYLMYLFYSIK